MKQPETAHIKTHKYMNTNFKGNNCNILLTSWPTVITHNI